MSPYSSSCVVIWTALITLHSVLKKTFIFLLVWFLFFFSKLRENKKTAELIKTANLLFNSFEPYYMWDYIARWFEECCR